MKTDIEKAVTSFVKNGDINSYKIIFETYYKRLYTFSLKYVEDSYVSEDIVENVFIALWEKKKNISKVENLKSYLYAMTRNASLDYLKAEKKSVSINLEMHDTMELMDQYVIEEETHAMLYKALESLPQKCRKVFEMSCLDGIKYKDIADELQISINTVKSQRARAIQLLKEILKDYPFVQLFLMNL